MTWNEDRKLTIYGNKRREHKTHTTEVWNNSPLPEGTSHAVTVLPGRGGGHSGDPSGPTQRHTQDGASRAEQTDRGPGGAGSSGGQGRWSMVAVASSLGPASTAGTFVPPQKKSMGQLRGIRSPLGLNTHKTILKKTLVTVWSNTATAGWRDHNRLAWPLNGGLEEATAGGGPSDRGRRVGLPRELQGAADGGLAFPRTPAWSPANGGVGEPRTAAWTEEVASWLSPPTTASGHESAAIRRAWVSGNPAGLSQRQSGGLESEAGRRALSQRQAGGHWVRGRPAGIESEAGRRALSQRRAGGLGLVMDGGVVISREPRDGRAANGGVNSRERRAWGGHDSLAARDKTQEQTKDVKKRKKQNEVKGRRLLFDLVFCHGAHSREKRGTRRRGYTSK